MKRVKLTHGSARIDDDCPQHVIDSLDELSKLAYEIHRGDDLNFEEDELLGYYCLGCCNIQNDRTGFGCDACGGSSLDEWYG
ncbi:hypothetical protein [Maribacter sp. ACAM166]|uniref:hypothetical protein n=1 Tax=Maribacter sp. ACAM166 TaxID=2508996 RepID=UPI0010FDB044|nr:hypothetical protein [Maribacter sp. ACAM166]TLP81374.1 hypothetical protein ES765_05035 [Maribacter sp. ACAM166]